MNIRGQLLPKLGLTLCLFASMTSSSPLHASCQLEWVFPATTCEVVRTKLVEQIYAWNDDENCKSGGEKCLYKLISSSSSQITATHTTPKKKYVDTLSMMFSSTDIVGSPNVLVFEKFQSTSDCRVMAHSSSNVWYAILDFGTNYCNLHNLVVGSGLINISGFTEKTSDSVCTQFTSADCDVY